MSYVSKTYEFLGKVESLFNRKMFKTAFIAISSMFLFFGVMNVYAQEGEKISPNWEGTKAFYNEASGTTADEDNMTSHSGQLGLNTAWVVLATLAPEYTEGGTVVMNNPDIPSDLKMGLLGISDQALAFVYRNQGNVNVVAHLQEEWVPGYKEANTGLYAGNGDNTTGYESLMQSGISPLWNQMRNIAYVFFIVIMIVIGFMIMFRSKLGGQTMVSIGNTIPSVIVSLILVTFSFAIAGVIIDFGGVIVNLLYNIFDEKSVSIQNIGQLFSVLFKGMDTELVNVFNGRVADVLTGFSSSIFEGFVNLLWEIDKSLYMGIIGILALLIGMGVVFVGAIKLIIVLYKAYFELLLNVVVGPITIMLGTLPGKENMKMNWLTSIVRNVLVFPIVYFIINIPVYLMQSSGVALQLPEKLTGANLESAVGDTATISSEAGYWGLVIAFVLRVFVLYYAAQAPKFAEAIVPVLETNRAAADAMASAKMGMAKIPLIGGLFAGK
jgi:hypothetical protein